MATLSLAKFLHASVLIHTSHERQIVAELLHRVDHFDRHVSIPMSPTTYSRRTDALPCFFYACEASGQLHPLALVCYDLEGQYSLLTSLITRVENLSSFCSLRQRTRPLAYPQKFYYSHLYTSPLLTTSSTFHLVLDSRSCTVTSQLNCSDYLAHTYQLLATSSTFRLVQDSRSCTLTSQLSCSNYLAHTHQLLADFTYLSIPNCLPNPSCQACRTYLTRSTIVSQKTYQSPRISSHLRRAVE